MAGVDFATIAKLFGADKLTMPVAIVTDADPNVTNDANVESPKADGDAFEVCDRVTKLTTQFAGNTQVAVFHSKVTLEYDLAEAGPANAGVIFDAWASCYTRKPKALTRAALDAVPTAREKALLLWRAVCRGDPAHGKAELAQALAGMLDDVEKGKLTVPHFIVPNYIEKALRHVIPRRDKTPPVEPTT
jgi:putative ATP-dependent endonuclease of OLD family